MRVALAGTFDRIHRGHKTIFEKAFALGDEILIGMTILSNRYKRELRSWKSSLDRPVMEISR
jgi:cytidyltransferase-like protein